MTPLALRITAFRPADRAERQSGLLGYLVLEIEGLIVLEAVTLRRTRNGTLHLSFPERFDAQGHRHPIVRPRNRDARRGIEKLVFEQLNLAHGAVEDDLC